MLIFDLNRECKQSKYSQENGNSKFINRFTKLNDGLYLPVSAVGREKKFDAPEFQNINFID